MSTVDEAVDKKAERRRLMGSKKFNRIGFKEEKVRFVSNSSSTCNSQQRMLAAAPISLS